MQSPRKSSATLFPAIDLDEAYALIKEVKTSPTPGEEYPGLLSPAKMQSEFPENLRLFHADLPYFANPSRPSTPTGFLESDEAYPGVTDIARELWPSPSKSESKGGKEPESWTRDDDSEDDDDYLGLHPPRHRHRIEPRTISSPRKAPVAHEKIEGALGQLDEGQQPPEENDEYTDVHPPGPAKSDAESEQEEETMENVESRSLVADGGDNSETPPVDEEQATEGESQDSEAEQSVSIQIKSIQPEILQAEVGWKIPDYLKTLPGNRTALAGAIRDNDYKPEAFFPHLISNDGQRCRCKSRIKLAADNRGWERIEKECVRAGNCTKDIYRRHLKHAHMGMARANKGPHINMNIEDWVKVHARPPASTSSTTTTPIVASRKRSRIRTRLPVHRATSSDQEGEDEESEYEAERDDGSEEEHVPKKRRRV